MILLQNSNYWYRYLWNQKQKEKKEKHIFPIHSLRRLELKLSRLLGCHPPVSGFHFLRNLRRIQCCVPYLTV